MESGTQTLDDHPVEMMALKTGFMSRVTRVKRGPGSTDGLPQGLIGKIDFAVSPADPSRVYALVEAVPEEEGLYRSNDMGMTWHVVSTEGYLDDPAPFIIRM